MFIVSTKEKERPWISGIFKDRHQAEAYYQSIPADLRRQQLITQIPLSYPFYTIEKNHAFHHVNKTGMIDELNRINVSKDKDEVYCTLYIIKSDYQPKKPGT